MQPAPVSYLHPYRVLLLWASQSEETATAKCAPCLPHAQVPTTLMAAVDASVGIKTAVNFHGRKNKLGTYCPPLAVFVDR